MKSRYKLQINTSSNVDIDTLFKVVMAYTQPLHPLFRGSIPTHNSLVVCFSKRIIMKVQRSEVGSTPSAQSNSKHLASVEFTFCCDRASPERCCVRCQSSRVSTDERVANSRWIRGRKLDSKTPKSEKKQRIKQNQSRHLVY